LIEDADARWSAGQVFERERVADIDRRHADSPYSRGYQAGINGVTGPAFPKGDASWEERLYARGWSDAALSPARLQEEDK
jgi:ribosome modulation factor